MHFTDPFFVSQFVLLTIGFVTVITFILTFFALGERTRFLWSTELPAVRDEDFINTLAHTANAPHGNGGRVTVLKTGDEFMNALRSAFEKAEKSINVTAYIWEKGRMSDELLRLLIHKARQGVEVRLLLDSLGGMRFSADYLNQIKDSGGKVDYFRAPEFGKLMRYHRRNHRRAIIIDGKVGFTGGAAIGDKWWGGEHGKPEWRDTMFQVEGAMARELQGAFAELWVGTHGEILTGEKFYPPLPTTPALCRYVHIASSPAPDTQPLPKFFWLSISAARKKLYITSPYVVPDKHIRHALIQRAMSGVDVRFLVPNELTDAKPIRQATHYYYRDFLRAGIRIYEYQPRMIHSKTLVVDGAWSVIGSANMDNRSKRLNEENVFGVLSEELGGELEQMFFEDLKQAKEIKLPEWNKRNFLSRSLEWASAWFVEQY